MAHHSKVVWCDSETCSPTVTLYPAVVEISPSIVSPKPKEISMGSEIVRKGIHLASLSIPIAYSFLTQQTMLLALIPLTIIAVFIDYGRHYAKWVSAIFNAVFAPILRE